MAVNEYIKKFSNDIYATKNDVVREMKTPLVDGIWSQILDYRRDFYETIAIPNFNSDRFSVCLTPAISKKINNFERKLTTVLNKFLMLQRNLASDYFKHSLYKRILKFVATKYKIDTYDTVLDGIIDGTIVYNLPADQAILQKYFSCLVDIEENFLQDVDENTLGNFYSKLMGSEDLTEYYRKKPSSKFSSGYDIGQVKIGVAPQNIESAVDQLMRYIKYDEKQSLIVKAIAIFYYLYFIKPFENYSEEVAILTMKKFLASNDVNAVAPYIAFEVLLVDKAALESKINDCQKSGDLTYLVNYILNLLDPIIDQMEDDIAKSQAQTLKVDTFQADPLPPRPENKEPIFKEGRETVSIPVVEKVPLTEKELQETGFNQEENAENEPLDEEIKEETPVLNEQEVTTEEIVQKEEVSNLDVNETPKAEEKVEEVKTIDSPSEEEKRAREELARPMQPTIEGAEKLHFSQNLAISNVPTGLSEEDAQKLETHLMELNPSLSRGQAYFYARHCTIGMYYTVDQYKKEVGCAYETARCNMNNLVLLGYYKKATLKKKYVYIPVKRN